MRNAICFAATEDFMVLRHAVTPSYRSSVQLNSPRRRLPTLRQRAEWQNNRKGNSLHEHHHGHDERAEARI
jgi:hypothetical protein